MWPRSFFPGSYFAPSYWPASTTQAVADQLTLSAVGPQAIPPTQINVLASPLVAVVQSVNNAQAIIGMPSIATVTVLTNQII